MNYKFTVIFIALSVCFTTNQIPAAAQSTIDPVQIVAKVVNAYGGRTVLERIKVVKHTGTIQSYRLKKTGTLQRLFMRPDKLRVELNYPQGPQELRITTPAGAWRNGRPATTPMHAAMTLQAARFQLPLILTEKPVTVLGEQDSKIQLGITLTADTSLEISIDPKSWHIVRSVGRMKFSGMDMAFIADYSDFRKVEGALFAFREDLTAMGRPTGIAQLEHIEINSKVRPEDFKPK